MDAVIGFIFGAFFMWVVMLLINKATTKKTAKGSVSIGQENAKDSI